MAKIKIREKLHFPVEPAEAYDFLLSTDAFEMFEGYGPVPGIKRIEWDGPNDQVGAIGIVHSSDGGTHREKVVIADRPHAYVINIWGFSSAFRFLTTGARESWALQGDGKGGTLGTREFSFSLRSPLLYPLGRVVAVAFRKALQGNHENFRRHFRARAK